MGTFQNLFQQGVDFVHRPVFDAMSAVLGEDGMEMAYQTAASFENGMESLGPEARSAARWIGNQGAHFINDVIERITQPRVEFSRPCVETARFSGWSVSFVDQVPVYPPSFYSFCYQANPCLFFSAMSACWQMGVNPFFNPQFFFQMLLHLMMQNFLFFPGMIPFMGVAAFLPGIVFRPAAFFL